MQQQKLYIYVFLEFTFSPLSVYVSNWTPGYCYRIQSATGTVELTWQHNLLWWVFVSAVTFKMCHKLNKVWIHPAFQVGRGGIMVWEYYCWPFFLFMTTVYEFAVSVWYIVEIWTIISEDCFWNLVLSMPRNIKIGVDNKSITTYQSITYIMIDMWSIPTGNTSD